MSGPNDCEVGTYYYLQGRELLCTWEPMTSGELTLEYDATFTTIGIDDADGNFEAGDVDIPADFEEMVIEYCLWKAHERQKEPWNMRKAIMHERNFKDAVREARKYSNRGPGKRGYARGTTM